MKVEDLEEEFVVFLWLAFSELRTRFVTRAARSSFLGTGYSWLRSLVISSLDVGVDCALAWDVAQKTKPLCSTHTAVLPGVVGSLILAPISSSQFLPMIAMPKWLNNLGGCSPNYWRAPPPRHFSWRQVLKAQTLPLLCFVVRMLMP